MIRKMKERSEEDRSRLARRRGEGRRRSEKGSDGDEKGEWEG